MNREDMLLPQLHVTDGKENTTCNRVTMH